MDAMYDSLMRRGDWILPYYFIYLLEIFLVLVLVWIYSSRSGRNGSNNDTTNSHKSWLV